MSAAITSQSAKRKLSPDAKGVYVTMTPERLKRLDEDRSKLDLSRGGFLAKVYDVYRDDLVAGLLARVEADEAGAESMQALVDASCALSDAWGHRALQRQRIGVHTNQIARLANVLAVRARQGAPVSQDDVESLVLALQGIERRLTEQSDAERDDDTLRAVVRAIVEQMRGRA